MSVVSRINYLTGSKIKLHTPEGIYFGVVVSSSSSCPTTVSLSKVSCLDDDGAEEQLSGMWTFSQEEIEDFECIDLPQPKVSKQPPPSLNVQKSPVPSSAKPKPPSVPCVVDAPVKPKPPSAPCVEEAPEPKPATEDCRTNWTPSTIVDTAVNNVPDASWVRQLSPPPSVTPDATKPPGAEEKAASKKEGTENVPPFPSWSQKYAFRDIFLENVQTRIKRPKHFVVIDQLDAEFDEAVEVLSHTNTIGCGFDGINLGRRGKLCWIVMSASETVFLFDVLALDCHSAFDLGLRFIFECPTIIKVFHDCRNSADILFHQFNIQPVNVYDTQVADILNHKLVSSGRIPKYVRCLATLLKECLTLTESQAAFYQLRKVVISKDNLAWSHRPLSVANLEACALNVRYLRELRLVTLERMLSEFTSCVDVYLAAPAERERDQTQGDECLVPKEFFKFGICDNYQRRDPDQFDRQRRDPSYTRYQRHYGCNTAVERLTNEYVDGRGDRLRRSPNSTEEGEEKQRTLPLFLNKEPSILPAKATTGASVPVVNRVKQPVDVTATENGPVVVLHVPFTNTSSSFDPDMVSDYAHMMSRSAVDRMDNAVDVGGQVSGVVPLTSCDVSRTSRTLNIFPVGFIPRPGRRS